MSCLFQSVSTFLPGVNADQLREKVCDYLSKNGRLFDDMTSGELVDESYVSRMRHRSSWGGGLEIRAMCELLDVRIVIKPPSTFTSERVIFIPLSNLFTNTIFLNYTGSHYTPGEVELF